MRLHACLAVASAFTWLAFAPKVARADDAGDAGASDGGADAGDAGVVDAAPPIIGTSCSPTDDKCQKADFDVSKTDKFPGDFDFDTDWQPPSSPVQIRLICYLHDDVTVGMGGTLKGTWPSPVSLRPDARLGTGSLSIDEGFELKLQARFHVTVAGTDYSWTGDVPGVPSINLAATNSLTFDPWAWDLGPSGPAGPSVSAKTPQNKLVSYSLTDKIIPIPGIDGGIELDGQAEYTASYNTLRIAFDELLSPGATSDVNSYSAVTKFPFASAPALDTSLFVHGKLAHGMTLHFIPAFYFTIVGSKFEINIADLPIALPSKTKNLDFDPVAIHLPMPRIDASPGTVDLGNIAVGESVPILLTVRDTGEATLRYSATEPTGTVTLPTGMQSVAPGMGGSLAGTLIAKTPGHLDVTVELDSNDPMRPKAYVHLVGNGTDVGDAGPAMGPGTGASGGCGCGVAGERGTRVGLASASLLALTLLGRRRRRAQA